jgi:hypothetical protein
MLLDVSRCVQSKVAVADDTGMVQCFQVKKGVTIPVFKLPLPATEGRVECLAIGATKDASKATVGLVDLLKLCITFIRYILFRYTYRPAPQSEV